MRFVLPLFSVLLLGTGCSTSADVNANRPSGAGGAPGAAGSPNSAGATAVPTSLVIEELPTLPARARVEVRVHAEPAQSYHVRFGLPTSNGDPLDAVLDRSEVDTNEMGEAAVQLTAPSQSTSFEIRASVASASASIVVNVEDTGLSAVQVQPRYASALRDITTWIATAHPGKTCADVPGIPPADGPLSAPPAAKDQAPVIMGVPSETPLAITLRSGHFVGGCTSIEGLPAGPEAQPQIVQVAVLNRPIDLTASSLAISLGLDATDTTWNAALKSAQSAITPALLGSSVDDVDALLDAMRDASADSVQTFEATRKAEAWDDLVRKRWGTTAATKLRDAVGGWLASGRQRLASTAHLLEGTLSPIAQGGQADGPSALLTLTRAVGMDAAQAGFVTPARVTWSANADDTVLIGTEIYLIESQLAMALAEAAALHRDDSLPSASDALAATADCSGLSTLLTQAGSDSSLAYAECDTECLQALCLDAARSLWQRGASATALRPARLTVSGTGTAHVGDAADIAGMAGTWIGDLKSDADAERTGGTVTAAASSPSP